MAQNQNLSYRLSLDLGTTSIGWAMIRLDQNQNPSAIIKAGVRIYSRIRSMTVCVAGFDAVRIICVFSLVRGGGSYGLYDDRL